MTNVPGIFNRIGFWVLAALAAIAAVIVWIMRGRLEAEDVGEAKGKADADRKRLDEAEAAGDDEAVEREWRRHRK